MEEIFEPFIKPVARVALSIVRFLIYLFWDLCIEIGAWTIGWCALRVMTFGRYPRNRLLDGDQVDTSTRIIVEVVGIALPIGLFFLLSGYLDE